VIEPLATTSPVISVGKEINLASSAKETLLLTIFVVESAVA
jgi:hypothetical protein